MRGTEVATVWRKVLSHHLWQRVVWETDGVELAHDLQAAEVVGHVEVLKSIGGVEDEVKLELVWVVPALVVGADELLGSHLESVVLLVWGVGDGVNLSTKGGGPHDGKVTETTTVQLSEDERMVVTILIVLTFRRYQPSCLDRHQDGPEGCRRSNRRKASNC